MNKKILTVIGVVSFGALSTLALSRALSYVAISNHACGYALSRDMAYGSSDRSTGGEVTTLQRFLRDNGYLNAIPNGNFGPLTRSALISYQLDSGIYGSGVVDATVRDFINNSYCNGTYTGQVYSSNTSVPTGYSDYRTMSGTASYSNTNVSNVSSVVSVSPVYTASNVLNSPIVVNQGQVMPYGAPITGCSFVYPGYCNNNSNVSLVMTTPKNGAVYREGDTVVANFYLNGNASNPNIDLILENKTTKERVVLGRSNGGSVSGILTKDLLDRVCANCGIFVNQEYSLVLRATFVENGIGRNLESTVTPVFITRQAYINSSNFLVTSTKSTIESGEIARIGVMVSGNGINTTNVKVGLKLLCESGVTGYTCGTKTYLPLTTVVDTATYDEVQAISNVTLTNNSYFFTRNAKFVLTLEDANGVVLSEKELQVNVKPVNY